MIRKIQTRLMYIYIYPVLEDLEEHETHPDQTRYSRNFSKPVAWLDRLLRAFEQFEHKAQKPLQARAHSRGQLVVSH